MTTKTAPARTFLRAADGSPDTSAVLRTTSNALRSALSNVPTIVAADDGMRIIAEAMRVVGERHSQATTADTPVIDLVLGTVARGEVVDVDHLASAVESQARARDTMAAVLAGLREAQAHLATDRGEEVRAALPAVAERLTTRMQDLVEALRKHGITVDDADPAKAVKNDRIDAHRRLLDGVAEYTDLRVAARDMFIAFGGDVSAPVYPHASALMNLLELEPAAGVVLAGLTARNRETGRVINAENCDIPAFDDDPAAEQLAWLVSTPAAVPWVPTPADLRTAMTKLGKARTAAIDASRDQERILLVNSAPGVLARTGMVGGTTSRMKQTKRKPMDTGAETWEVGVMSVLTR